MKIGRAPRMHSYGVQIGTHWYCNWRTFLRWGVAQPLLCRLGSHEWYAGEHGPYCPNCGEGVQENFGEVA